MTTLLNEWASMWGNWFGAALLQNTIFIGLVFLALRYLREAPARVRALIATVGIVKLVVPPFLPAGLLRSSAPERVIEPVAMLLFPFEDAGTTATGPIAQVTGGLSAVAILLMIWAGIVVALLAMSLLQTLRLARNLRDSEPVAGELLPAEFQRSGLSVRRCRHISMPLTKGLRSRRIFVPAAWDSWPAEMRLAVLRHELAHIQRHDGIVQGLEILVQSLFFFHPLVVLLIRRSRMLREMACDDISVADDPRARLDYSSFLVSLAESNLGLQPATASASTLARHRSELAGRVSYQIKESLMNTVPRKKIIATLLVLLLVALPLSLVFGHDAQTPPPPPRKASKSEVLKEKPPKSPQIQVAFDENDKLTVEGKATRIEDFEKVIRKTAASMNDNVVIRIASDGGASMGSLHRIQRTLRKLDMTRVVYAGVLAKAVPMMLPPEKMESWIKAKSEAKVVHVNISGKGVATLGDKQIDGADLESMVRKIVGQDENTIVILETDQNTRYGAFVQVLNSIKQGGATRIAITDPGK